MTMGIPGDFRAAMQEQMAASRLGGGPTLVSSGMGMPAGATLIGVPMMMAPPMSSSAPSSRRGKPASKRRGPKSSKPKSSKRGAAKKTTTRKPASKRAKTSAPKSARKPASKRAAPKSSKRGAAKSTRKPASKRAPRKSWEPVVIGTGEILAQGKKQGEATKIAKVYAAKNPGTVILISRRDSVTGIGDRSFQVWSEQGPRGGVRVKTGNRSGF